MTTKDAVAPPVGQSAETYLKKFAPRKGQGDGPSNPPQPWLRDFYENGFQQLWDAVLRLEQISHNGETSANVGGPVLVAPKGPRPGPDKRPPPPPPAFP